MRTEHDSLANTLALSTSAGSAVDGRGSRSSPHGLNLRTLLASGATGALLWAARAGGAVSAGHRLAGGPRGQDDLWSMPRETPSHGWPRPLPANLTQDSTRAEQGAGLAPPETEAIPHRRLARQVSQQTRRSAPVSLFDSLPEIVDGMWIAKKDGVMQFSNVATERSKNVVALLKSVDQEHPLIPDFAPTLVCSRDYFEWCVRDMPDKMVPGKVAFAFGLDARTSWALSEQKVLHVPDCVFQNWVAIGMDDYDQMVAQMQEAGRHPPTRNVAGWVGNVKTHPTRTQLVTLSAHIPDDLEAIEMDWRPAPEGETHLSHTPGYRTLVNQTASWAYLLDLQGSGYSFRFKMLMHTNRPILRQDHPWLEYYYPMLHPYEHYVPIAHDLHDLPAKISWLKSNPEEGARIARNAQAFAQKHLSRTAAKAVWAQRLHQLAHLP